MTSQLADTRRDNLQRILNERFGGVIADLARAVDKAPTYVWFLLTDNADHRKRLGEKLARDFEAALGLDKYALDQPTGQQLGLVQKRMSPAAEKLLALIRKADAEAALDDSLATHLGGMIQKMMSGSRAENIGIDKPRGAITYVQEMAIEQRRSTVPPSQLADAIIAAYQNAVAGKEMPKRAVLKLVKG